MLKWDVSDITAQPLLFSKKFRASSLLLEHFSIYWRTSKLVIEKFDRKSNGLIQEINRKLDNPRPLATFH